MKASSFLVGVLIFIGLMLLARSMTAIPAGHVGVVSTFGNVDDATLDSGLSLVAPWKTVREINIQTKEVKEAADVPTKEGASVHLEVSMLYALSKGAVVDVYKTVGVSYEDVLVKSQFRSALRGATVHYKAEDLYTANREKIEEEIYRSTKDMLGKRGILVEAVLLRDMQLPELVKKSIELKLAAEQDNLRMTFVIQQAEKEAERKVKEAKGIADAQMIIKKDLDHNYLVYLWIEALRETAKHNNAVIYIPTGSDGMPLFKQVK